MKTAHANSARMFVLTLVLALTLVGCICLVCEHGAHCGDPLCTICELLDSAAAPSLVAAVALIAPIVFIARRPNGGMSRQSASLVCYRVRLDD